MIVQTLKMCTFYFGHISGIFSHFCGVLNLDIFYVNNDLMVPSLCNLCNFESFCSFIQTLYNDCSNIEDVHLLFWAHFRNIFSFLRGV